jgi:hypothetical protein
MRKLDRIFFALSKIIVAAFVIATLISVALMLTTIFNQDETDDGRAASHANE